MSYRGERKGACEMTSIQRLRLLNTGGDGQPASVRLVFSPASLKATRSRP